jgi:hypothetical protein
MLPFVIHGRCEISPEEYGRCSGMLREIGTLDRAKRRKAQAVQAGQVLDHHPAGSEYSVSFTLLAE